VASFGHIAVGIAAARIYRTERSQPRASLTAMLLWAALSFLPDADVIGFALGIRYEDEWGHRGATHSLVFSIALGTLIGVLAPRFRLPAVRTGVTASLVLASHALLDTLTDGGLGCALFWPFDRTRYFAPWTPLPVSPIGLSFFSPYGMYVAATELLLFAPLLWFAMRWRARASLIGAWAVGLWLFTSSDPLRERVIRLALRDDTEFAAGFSESGLSSFTRGAPSQGIRQQLGAPLSEFVLYEDRPGVCSVVRIDQDIVAMAQAADACRDRGIQPGTPRAAALQELGTPRETCWLYSRSPDGGYFRLRAICFAGDRVTQVVRRWVRQ
jgi:inner membrane protein